MNHCYAETRETMPTVAYLGVVHCKITVLFCYLSATASAAHITWGPRGRNFYSDSLSKSWMNNLLLWVKGKPIRVGNKGNQANPCRKWSYLSLEKRWIEVPAKVSLKNFMMCAYTKWLKIWWMHQKLTVQKPVQSCALFLRLVVLNASTKQRKE